MLAKRLIFVGLLTMGLSLMLMSFVFAGDRGAYPGGVATYLQARGVDLSKQTPGEFIRGDVAPPGAQDGACTMADGLMILGYYFGETGLDCMDAGDVDDNGEVTMGDGLRVLGYYFGDLASAPEPPFPDCALDPTADGLDCVSHYFCMPPK